MACASKRRDGKSRPDPQSLVGIPTTLYSQPKSAMGSIQNGHDPRLRKEEGLVCVEMDPTLSQRAAPVRSDRPNTRLGVLTRHKLEPGHPSAETHRLVEHTNELRGEGSDALISWVTGMSIPRKSDKGYKMFALAHFVPFDINNPLLRHGQTTDDVFEHAQLTERHQQILNNWEAIHKCQDECDAEWMRKRAEMTQESQAMTRALHGSINTAEEIDVDIRSVKGKKV